jgi:hypothetical protein
MKLKLFLLLCLIPLLGACAKYKARPLRNLSTLPVQGTNKVTFAAEAFGKGKSKTYLERNVIKRGYIPVQIAIKNESKDKLVFSKSNISLKAENIEDVINNVSFDPMERGIAYGIPGILLAFNIPLIIAAVVDPVWAVKANEKLLSDYLKKSLSDSLIMPNSTLEGLIFVAVSNFTNRLKVVLVKEGSKEEIVCEASL